MNSTILLLFAAAVLIAGGAALWAAVNQPEPKRVPVRRLPRPGARREL